MHLNKPYTRSYDSCSSMNIYGVPHGILRIFINILYENVFQKPQISCSIILEAGRCNLCSHIFTILVRPQQYFVKRFVCR
jgi:hypothetical protein